MHVGMMLVFASHGWEKCPDARVWDEEIRLARLAANRGFDGLWSAEHLWFPSTHTTEISHSTQFSGNAPNPLRLS